MVWCWNEKLELNIATFTYVCNVHINWWPMHACGIWKRWTTLYISCKITILCDTRANASLIICCRCCCYCCHYLGYYSGTAVTETVHRWWHWKCHQNGTFTFGNTITGKCSPKPLLLLLDNRNNCTPCTHNIFLSVSLWDPSAWEKEWKCECKRKWKRQDENTVRYFKVLHQPHNK